jgi:hypothetical protein
MRRTDGFEAHDLTLLVLRRGPIETIGDRGPPARDSTERVGERCVVTSRIHVFERLWVAVHEFPECDPLALDSLVERSVPTRPSGPTGDRTARPRVHTNSARSLPCDRPSHEPLSAVGVTNASYKLSG